MFAQTLYLSNVAMKFIVIVAVMHGALRPCFGVLLSHFSNVGHGYQRINPDESI